MPTLNAGNRRRGRYREFICQGMSLAGGQATPPGCGAKLRLTEEDIIIITRYLAGGGVFATWWFMCPKCGVETGLVSDEVF